MKIEKQQMGSRWGVFLNDELIAHFVYEEHAIAFMKWLKEVEE